MGSEHKQKRKNKKNKRKRHGTGDSDQFNEHQKFNRNEELEETDSQGADEQGETESPNGSSEKLSREQEIADDDSDVEDQPKRKKKKKQVVPTDNDNTGNKKAKKSIRQMKREKFAQRQAEAQAVAKDEHKSECLNYLSQWKHNRQNWKFMKVKQGWLFKNKFSASLVPDASWPTLLEYFESAQGNIKKLLLEDANKIIKQLDDWTESQGKENKDSGETEETQVDVTRPDDIVYKRARDLIQCLQE